MYRSHILVCGGTGCTSSGSAKVIEALEKELAAKGLSEEIKVIRTGCFGLCSVGPIMIVYPDGAFYSGVQTEDIPEIVTEHLLKGRPVKRLLYQETVAEETIKSLDETGFYKKQKRVALRNCGVINPENIEEYIAYDGYEALGKVLTEYTPEQVIQIILDSGLRGRGGAGFPTGLKWKFAAANKADQKYVCCNADEGDPGAFMDRSVLEGDPHAVLEAMAIAGYAIGASQGYVYVRAEYPIAVKRLSIAITQARELGLLGKNIFGTGFDFDVDIRLGAGAFVCGDETALMTSIEGMMIAGYAIGAQEGNFYVRAEYPTAIHRLKVAIKQAEEIGLLGDNIMGTDFSFRVYIRPGAGAFVCGEETALLNSIEGKRGMPRPRPPFPAVKGLWEKPTIVNNVETLACVPYILREGAEKFAQNGTEKSKGTKVFALGGKVNNVGLVEVPMGTTLRELIFDIGGGIPNG
ncbi:MAG: NAD(P)H-dependent oxidoreductase subunit E, partial [Clostridia bacterium]|nr:NAD(P)H-dependent oxidoreductase subunit E [Clostridia bacterium]